jgi:hypothetical protein
VKLALAVPSYGPIDPHIDKALRVAIMTASNHGITWAGDVSTIRVGWVEGRNGALDAALESGADGLFWMDDDILLPPNAIIQLASYGKDFTSGMYFQKFFPHWPLFAMFNGVKFNWFRDFPDESKLFEVDGVGFGCAFTSAKLLKALKDKFEKPFEWTEFSEDFTFCLRAGELGMKPWVDSGIKCGHSHLLPAFVTEENFRAAGKAMENTVVDGKEASIVRVA